MHDRHHEMTAGHEYTRGFRDRGRHLVYVLHRHERDRDVGDPIRDR